MEEDKVKIGVSGVGNGGCREMKRDAAFLQHLAEGVRCFQATIGMQKHNIPVIKLSQC
jgi:hypothetical protein